ncbi:MAG: helical backbone metal receptor [Actinomycetota bacterium]|nr:helical backbone metal receptor [Actinomycetota bacterium]
MRVVSLVPSMTESLLTSSATLVGVTRYCEVEGFEVIGGTKDPDIDAISKIAPDLVILDRHENRRQDFEAIASRGLEVYATSIASIEELAHDFTELNQRFDLRLPKIDTEAIGEISKRLAAIDRASGSLSARDQNPIKALVPIWRNPYMVINSTTYAGDLLRHIGVRVVGGESEYSKVDLATFRGQVDLILAPSEPYKFTKRQLPELQGIAKVVEFVDGKDLFWWGTRTMGAIERLGEQIARISL